MAPRQGVAIGDRLARGRRRGRGRGRSGGGRRGSSWDRGRFGVGGDRSADDRASRFYRRRPPGVPRGTGRLDIRTHGGRRRRKRRAQISRRARDGGFRHQPHPASAGSIVLPRGGRLTGPPPVIIGLKTRIDLSRPQLIAPMLPIAPAFALFLALARRPPTRASPPCSTARTSPAGSRRMTRSCSPSRTARSSAGRRPASLRRTSSWSSTSRMATSS